MLILKQAYENSGNGTRESEKLRLTLEVKKVNGTSPPDTSGLPLVAIVVPCIFVFLIIFVVIIVLFMRRSKPQKNKKYHVSTKRKDQSPDDVRNKETSEEDSVGDAVDAAPKSRFVDEAKENLNDAEKGNENPLFNELNKIQDGALDLESD